MKRIRTLRQTCLPSNGEALTLMLRSIHELVDAVNALTLGLFHRNLPHHDHGSGHRGIQCSGIKEEAAGRGTAAELSAALA